MTTVISVNQAEQPEPLDDSMLRPEPAVVTRTNSNRSANETKDSIVKGKKLGHRRVKDGEVTYKKFETTQLMGSIQLGIQQSVGNLGSQEDRDLLHEDFYTVETVIFSRDGTLQKTPAHNYSQFKFRTFAPLAFRVFRNIFGIERDKFLVSLCAEPMIELSNPGASGSIFYVTQDDEIICKTVSHKESKFLQEILPAYYLNLHQNIRTLLPKFFGFFCYSCNTKNVRIIVMKNLLPSGLEMHHKFDLKGSTYKRKASRKERNKSHPTFKDLDFMDIYPDGILLQPELYNSLFDTIERDCRALESLKIMDYSFLMGIHNLDQAGTRKPLMYQMEQKFFGETDPGGGGSDASEDGEGGAGLDRVGSFQHKQRLIAHSTALESITAEVDMEMGDDEEQDIMEMCNTWGGIPAKNHKGENLLIFIGIIDILQSYGVAKKLEHTWKSIIHDGDTVSVHHPAFYAKRFKQFLSDKVFKKMPSNLKPALSFRRPAAPPKRLMSKESNAGETQETRVERMSQSVDNSVTVITIGADVQGQSVPDSANTSSILPSVLRDKPRTSTVSAPSPASGATQGHVTRTRAVSGHVAGPSSRPDVADVEGAACTPPPDLGVGGITSDDERIQIYVPSPQSTPYSTISRQVPETHKNITFVNYKADEVEMSPTSSHGGVSVSVVQEQQETSSMVQVYQKAAAEENQSPLFSQRSLQIEEQQPVSLSHVEIDLEEHENASNEC